MFQHIKSPVDKAEEKAYTLIMIITVEVIHDGALDLLSDMERLNLIRINASSKITIPQKKKLSECFAGVLHLSDTRYEAYQNALQEGRDEWQRDIY